MIGTIRQLCVSEGHSSTARLFGRRGTVRLVSVLAGAVLAVVSCDSSPSVDINPDDYTHVITNQFFPLVPGSRFTYADIWHDDTTERVFIVDQTTDTIAGVTCCVATDSGRTSGYREGHYYKTRLSYAQHTNGEVHKFGSRRIYYRDGQPYDDGSWLAGDDGEKPLLVMRAAPQVGDTYRSSWIIWSVLGTDETAVVPAGTYAHCVLVRTWTFGGSSDSRNYYAPGVGFVLSVDTAATLKRTELTNYSMP